MPLTEFQKTIAKLLATNRTPESHLAGGAALHASPDSLRYSEDLDYFHDSESHVAKAFEEDFALLEAHSFTCAVEMNQRGYIHCIVSKGTHSTKIEWAQDTVFRFFPAQQDLELGYVLHPIDLAINKLLALVGRDEPRDFLDVVYTHESILPLGAQVWAACGKDPGYSPGSLLDLLKRRGRYQPEDFKRLRLTSSVDLQKLKSQWMTALSSAEEFLKNQNPENIGCLFYSKSRKVYIQPNIGSDKSDLVLHFGKQGGVIPQFV